MGKLTISMAMFKFANCKRLPEGLEDGGNNGRNYDLSYFE